MPVEDDIKTATKDIEDAAKGVSNMAAVLAELKKAQEEMGQQIEKILKAQAQQDKAAIRPNEEEKIVGLSYGFIRAKQDAALGKSALAPYWDDRTIKRFGEFLQAKKAKDMQTIRKMFEKDFEAYKKAFGDNVQDNLANWTPTEFIPELVRLAYVTSVMLPLVTIIPMSRDQSTMPRPSGSYTWGFAAPGSAMTESKFTPGTMSLNTAKMYGMALINQEDLDDPAYPVALYVAAQLGEDFAIFVDKIILDGDADGGDVWDGYFDGWSQAASVQAVTGGTDASPTFAELLTVTNLTSAIAKLDEQQLDGVRFIMSPQAWAAIRGIQAKVSDGAGGTTDAGTPIIPINAAWDYPLFGYPVTRTSRALTVPAASETAVYFGNPKYIYYGDRMNMEIKTSEHYRFTHDQVTFRATSRGAVTVGLPANLVKIVFGAAE